MTLEVKKNAQGVIQVIGPLTFETARDGLALTKALISSHQTITIDLSGVGHCDSAGLAYLTSVMRFAKNQQSQVLYTGLPKQMTDLGRVSGLDVILNGAC